MWPFQQKLLCSDLEPRLTLDLERAQEIEEPVLDRVEGDCGKLGFAPAEPAGAFAGAHEVTRHQAELKSQDDGSND